MGQKINSCNILNGESDKMRQFGRPNSGWSNNINMEIKIVHIEFILMAEHFVKNVMNIGSL